MTDGSKTIFILPPGMIPGVSGKPVFAILLRSGNFKIPSLWLLISPFMSSFSDNVFLRRARPDSSSTEGSPNLVGGLIGLCRIFIFGTLFEFVLVRLELFVAFAFEFAVDVLIFNVIAELLFEPLGVNLPVLELVAAKRLPFLIMDA